MTPIAEQIVEFSWISGCAHGVRINGSYSFFAASRSVYAFEIRFTFAHPIEKQRAPCHLRVIRKNLPCSLGVYPGTKDVLCPFLVCILLRTRPRVQLIIHKNDWLGGKSPPEINNPRGDNSIIHTY